jgi:cell division septal protein FtsQ
VQPRKPYRPVSRLRQATVFLSKVLILLSLAGGGTYAFGRYIVESPRFLVRSINVEGENILQEEEILRAAGITTQDNLLLFPLDEVRDRVVAMPYVATCKIERGYPDSVVIRLVERIAAAVLMVENRAYEIDVEGNVLREVASYAPSALPLITNLPELSAVSAGQRLEQPALRMAMALWDTLRTSPLVEQLSLSEISAQGPEDLRVFFDELNYETRWGRSDFSEQSERLLALWHEKGGALPCKDYLDLRFDENLVCR